MQKLLGRFRAEFRTIQALMRRAAMFDQAQVCRWPCSLLWVKYASVTEAAVPPDGAMQSDAARGLSIKHQDA